MRVLIVGGGGREHALAWKCAESSVVTRVYVAPGNAGTALEPGVENLPVGSDDLAGLVRIAKEHSIDLTIVGPEQPLVDGLTDRFRAAGLRCFGPSAEAARLEGSKAFTKAFLQRHGIPTAAYQAFTEANEALDYLASQPLPAVIKADGLAAGKGVVIAQTLDQAGAAVTEMLQAGRFGDAGRKIVIEEFLTGEEASFIAVVDGQTIVPMASSQDHKTRDDGDRGPNTGGMGAYSPAPVLTEELHERVMDEIMRPTVAGLEADGSPYRGFLYAGLMIDGAGQPRVLEFNCRFGDPETQPVLMRLRSDLAELCRCAADGELAGFGPVEWDSRPALGVVMAAGGYPSSYAKGRAIEGLSADQDDPDLKIFHAGTRLDGDSVVTSGGRVLCAVALGDDIAAAQQRAYELVGRVSWDDAFYRTDIGYRALARLQS